MTIAALEVAAKAHHLEVMGACHAMPEDRLGSGTIVLLGPLEPGFWAYVTNQAEFRDGAPDPLDRWSNRATCELAEECGEQALLPFGKPVRPFISWALRSGRAWISPVGLLVHDRAGLMVSYRGAILISERLKLPEVAHKPCHACTDKPCLTACPVGALSGEGYDLDACHTYLDTPAGLSCMTKGCAARRACPAGHSYGRVHAQSAYHMNHFHPHDTKAANA